VTRPICVLIAADFPALRQCLGDLVALSPDLAVLAATSVRESVDVARQTHPDVVVIEVGSQGTVESVRQLLTELRSVSVVGFAVLADDQAIAAAREAGVDLFIQEPDPDIFFQAVRQATHPMSG